MTKKAKRRRRDAEIRRLYRHTELTQQEIADRKGVSRSLVQKVIADAPDHTTDPDRPPPGGETRCPTCGGPWWFRGHAVRE